MDGISFIVRVRNEEETIKASLLSLKDLTIPYEIIVILHLCTDRSREIVESLKEELPLKIVEYSLPISRPGYETLVTDATSEHSIPYYCNWCFSHANHIWKFKWDADFISSPELVEYLNSNTWTKTVPSRVFFIAKNDEMSNAEGYLFTGDFEFKKYYFWEYLNGSFEDKHTGININHVSKLSNLKKYWTYSQWFCESDSDEAKIVRDRYNKLITICGKELIGGARASNLEGDEQYRDVLRNEEELKQHNINPND